MEESNIVDFNRTKSRRAKKPIELTPQSANQEKYIEALLNPETDIVMVSGPAGTGKTYLAMLAAIDALREGDCNKLVLTRPAVGVAGEEHGFLPGDLNEKMDPWVRPLFDVLREYYNHQEIDRMIAEQIIEIVPLAFCRGRTFKKAWIVLDESQNCTIPQCKMILTRIGEGSKLVITGDTDQADRPDVENGLMDLVERAVKYPNPRISVCEFDERDVRRHQLIPHILRMYR